MTQETNLAERQHTEVARRQVFNNPQFGELRVTGTADKPMFCLADVCKALNLKNAADVKDRLDPKGIGSTYTPTEGGQQQMLFVDEPNLYRCIFQSRKKEAKAFQDWVFGEVLPAIRKEGGYIATKADDTEDDIMARALLIADNRIKALKDRNATLQASCDDLQQKHLEQKRQIENLTPDAEYARQALTSTSTWNTNVIAKEFGMSAVTLNQHLKRLEIQYKQHGVWILNAKYQNKGYTKTTTFKYLQQDGSVGTRLQMEWTEQGRRWLHSLHDKGKF